MRKKAYKIITYLLLLLPYNAYAQINCTVPAPPILSSVTLLDDNSKTEIKWELSPSTDIAAYLIFKYSDEGGIPRGDIIDTVWNGAATSYIHTSTAYKYFSVSYVVAAYRLPVINGLEGCPSPFSNILNTIYCTSEIDSCENKISLNWNSYPDYPKNVLEYKILGSVNGTPLSELSRVDKLSNSYTLNDFQTNADYCFVIQAILEDGSVSTSNKSCLSTMMQRAPGWINADRATVTSENKILLDFTVDPLSEISLFKLEKKSEVSGTFQELAQITSGNGFVTYTDDKADIKSVNYYRLSAINNCNIPITTSNISSNIVLKYVKNGDDINLSWNSYKKWNGAISYYRLFVDLGNGYSEKLTLQPNDTVCKIAYNEIMYDVTSGKFCFYISASEISNPYGINGESISSLVCSEPTELITVPNLFTPDNDLINDLFKPVLSFIPIDYQLIISDRKGRVLFETRDFNSAWDGSSDGSPQAQGVFLWFLKLATPTGKTVSKTGTITIYRNR